MSGRIIRTDGSEEPIKGTVSMREAARLIGAETLDIVALKHLGWPLQVMLVDDAGWETEVIHHDDSHVELRPVRARRPLNAKATALYLQNCRPGTTHQIVGDVAVVYDDDFAAP